MPLESFFQAQMKRQEEELSEQHDIVKEKWENSQRFFKLIKKIEEIKVGFW